MIGHRPARRRQRAGIEVAAALNHRRDGLGGAPDLLHQIHPLPDDAGRPGMGERRNRQQQDRGKNKAGKSSHGRAPGHEGGI